jgi:hypothetical protein
MTDLHETATTIGELVTADSAAKAGKSVDDYLRDEVEKYRDKLRVAEVEIERERTRANSYLEKNQNITAGMFALLEPEILAAFTSMVDEAMNDITNTGAFERAVESIVEDRVETEFEKQLDRTQFIDSDDVNDQISDAFGDSHFDSCVRDVVKEMIRDGDITISVENIELTLDT